TGELSLQLDDHLKNLLRELGHAINDTVSESDRITGAIAGVRAHGYDIVLKLDATIGLAKRDGSGEDEPRLSTQDRRFLESLRIQVDQESLEQDTEKKLLPRMSKKIQWAGLLAAGLLGWCTFGVTQAAAQDPILTPILVNTAAPIVVGA